MEQAISNFVINALQHTEMGNKIKVTMRKENSNILVKVYNQGNGIDTKDISNIWDSFYVADKNKEKEEENNLGHTGLGLYIVKMAIEIHGGKYGVENVKDGVEFWFSLPALKEM